MSRRITMSAGGMAGRNGYSNWAISSAIRYGDFIGGLGGCDEKI